MSFLAAPFSYLLSGLYNVVGQYWIAVVILSIIVRVALYPVYKKQIMSSANMVDIQPKMRAIQKKYGNDRAMMNQKMQELYKEEGYNPAAGCLPMIVQLIVIAGLFTLFRYPLHYLSDTMVFAVHDSVLWIKDLSQPDLWILPILSGLATFFSFALSQQNNIQQPGGGVMMVVMKYAFPVMIVWLARSYPAALAIYWFISQVVQIFFNLRFNQLKKKLREEKANKKKKKKPVMA